MRLHRTKILVLLVVGFIFHASFAQANCKDPEFREQVTKTAKAEGVNESELLSIIAHESRCHYYTIAWNLPGKAQTAKSKYLDSLEDAKALAGDLIATKQFRVDVGIGQINNEAHIQPKGWTLEEVLNPKTALNRVAQVLKERSWANYHSNNPALARKWQGFALAALDQAIGSANDKKNIKTAEVSKSRRNSLLVYNVLHSVIVNTPKESKLTRRRGDSPLLVFLN